MALPNLFQQLQQLVATPSVSSHSERWDSSNRAVVELLADWLESLGFSIKLYPVDTEKRKWNLVATLGKGDGGLILAGHTDTVPYDDFQWQSDPFTLTEKDNRWYGLGATDMKGFFPVALEAISTFVDADLQQPIIVLATADEESSMSGAQALTRHQLGSARQAVIGEPTGMRPIRMHKGIMMEEVTVTGRAGHSSDPSLGNNAMEAMHRVMSELMSLRHDLQQRYQHSGFTLPTPSLNFGCIHGGDNPNRICGKCQMQFDLRGIPGMENNEIRQLIDRQLASVAEQTGTNIERKALFGGVSPFEQAAESELIQLVEQLTGQASEGVAFATEAPFLKQLGIDTVVMGPGSIDQAHQPNEFIPLDQIQPAIDTLRAMIKHYCL
jgi:acetylornithine deacetylase